jgi:hypothetical protein
MSTTVVAYADGMDAVDQYGPNARLTFWMAERHHDEGVRKVVVGRVIIPTAELVRVARQLCTLETPTDSSERPVRKRSSAVATCRASQDPRLVIRGSDLRQRRFFSRLLSAALCDRHSGKAGGS